MSMRKYIPRITFTNYRKLYPNMASTTFNSWLSVDLWPYSGRMWMFSVKHYSVCVDWTFTVFAKFLKRK